jgi:hypothetical protein
MYPAVPYIRSKRASYHTTTVHMRPGDTIACTPTSADRDLTAIVYFGEDCGIACNPHALAAAIIAAAVAAGIPAPVPSSLRPHVCGNCGAGFATGAELLAHIAEQHPVNNARPPFDGERTLPAGTTREGAGITATANDGSATK